ncbi:MAG: hypothetical protein C4529_07045 [Deltaproteobacteria bacterium]|nr:MAG: hypothetical protein C4529_07045 [Deltaproteobacteria bacterium]
MSNPNLGLWPRCEIELSNGKIVVPFTPRTLATIERESGLSSMEFAEKFSDPAKAQVFDLGMKIILGAIKSVEPTMTEELLSERIRPGTFLLILQLVAEKWAEGVTMAGAPIAETEKADPTPVGAVSP